MRKIIVAEHLSIDGVFQGPGGPEEDPSGGFQLGGWSVPYADEASGQIIMEMFAEPFELLLGRRTYDIWAAYWPRVRADHPIGDQFNRTAKHVATHRPESLDWENSHGLKGELADAVRALKAQDGPKLITWGSGQLVRQLLAAGLVDELILMTYPVILGHGLRLFDHSAQAAAFTPSHTTTSPSGVQITHYTQPGEVQTGAFNEID